MRIGHPEGSGVQPQQGPPHAGTNPPCHHPVLPSPHQLQLEGERHSNSSHKCFSYPSAWANTLKHHRYKLTLYWVSCHPTNNNSAEHEINLPSRDRFSRQNPWGASRFLSEKASRQASKQAEATPDGLAMRCFCFPASAQAEIPSAMLPCTSSVVCRHQPVCAQRPTLPGGTF